MNENTDETEIRKTDEKLTGEIKTNGETTEKGGTVCVFTLQMPPKISTEETFSNSCPCNNP